VPTTCLVLSHSVIFNALILYRHFPFPTEMPHRNAHWPTVLSNLSFTYSLSSPKSTQIVSCSVRNFLTICLNIFGIIWTDRQTKINTLFYKVTRSSICGDSRISTHADPMSTHRMIFPELRIYSMKFTSAHVYASVYSAVANSYDFGLVEEKSSKKWKLPGPRRR